MKTACFIPIKAHSERVPGKNLRVLNGKKLYQYICENVKKAEVFDDIYIDTNSDEVADYATTEGFNIIERRPELAQNTANGNDLLVYHYSLHPEYDYYFQLFATAPYLQPKSIRDCYKRLTSSNDYDSCFTATENHSFYWYAGTPVNYRPGILPRSQDMLPVIEETTGLYGIMKDTGSRISNVVMMGSGEPLDNYDESLKFIRMLTDERGLNISRRNVTLSTCGIVPRIRELADEELTITLAISLHACSDEKRRELMPVANKYSLDEIIDGRRLTFEYSLVNGVNDNDDDARGLAMLLRGLNCHVNLIPVNPVRERNYAQSTKQAVLAFKNKLEKNHINVTIRREMGRDIDGACGQLRRRVISESY